MDELLLHNTIVNHGYRKSNFNIKGVDAVYIYDRKISYAKREYETLTDSYGRTHSVQVGCKMIDIKLEDSHFEISSISSFEYLRHKFLSLDNIWTFQYSLKLYYMVGMVTSCFDEVSSILRKHERNHTGIERIRRHWMLDKFEYFPLSETCFVSANHRTIERQVPDSLFFGIDNKDDIDVAIKRLDSRCSSKLIEDGYLQMDDIKRLKYLNNRLKNKIDYINKYDYLFKPQNYETSEY